MLKLTSAKQALSLKGKIPNLAIVRMAQFEGMTNGFYDPDVDGFIVVLQKGDDIQTVPVAENGLLEVLDEDWPGYEYIHYVEDGERVYELVVQIDDSKTIAVIIEDSPWLDERVRKALKGAATAAPMPISEGVGGFE